MSFRKAFDRSVAAHDDAAYRRFVVKTMRFLALELENALPKTPILPALGNNDSDCGDYAITAGWRLSRRHRGDRCRHDRSRRRRGRDFARSWTALGSYAIDDPAQPGFRVIG